jgi:hypothetical protein
MVSPESEYGKSLLEKIDEIFKDYLYRLEWDDVGRWIQSWLLSHKQGLGELAETLAQARELLPSKSHLSLVSAWNEKLREQVRQLLTRGPDNRRILCAFSSAVDATCSDLMDLVQHAAAYKNITPEELLKQAHSEYQKDRTKDRTEVSTVVEALAGIMFGYEHPRANLKPNLKPGSEAEMWGRRFVMDKQNTSLILSGGGASFNIADALAGLGFLSHGFWPYHPKLLSERRLPCVGEAKNRLFRRWFNNEWRWQESEFNEAGDIRDQTGFEHPVRLSLILSFSPQSEIPLLGAPIHSADKGRVIFQFMGYRSAEFFKGGSSENWDAPPLFYRWRRLGSQGTEWATDEAMRHVGEIDYHRVILSSFHWASDEMLDKLREQCRGMRLHHEISARFESPAAVNQYCNALSEVYRICQEKTAGMNTDELAAFTSWHGTEVFTATLPDRKDSFLQSMFRAMKVREAFGLDWVYTHGNDIDITVVKSGKDPQYLNGLRDAMLLAKVVVFAALHVRAGLLTVKPEFELSCSPKGFLGLYQFARDFARQYGRSNEGRERLQRQILLEGYVCGNGEIPSVVTVPVYWPDPHEDCSMTGAGDITSGVTAAMAP